MDGPIKAVLIGPAAADERLTELNRLTGEAVLFERVDGAQGVDAISAACRGAKVVVAPNVAAVNDWAPKVEGLELIQTFSAGTDNIDKAKLLNLGIKVANNGGANAVCVAEHAIGLLIMVMHKLDRQVESARAGNWAADVTGAPTEFQTLVGKRVGIVGLGRIGSRVAKRLRFWECEVVYHDVVDYDAAYEAEAGASRVDLDELLTTSDIVSLHVPLDRVTRAMMSHDQFRKMKSTAILLNTCRGPVVDEAALIQAIETGEIHGAGLDVTEIEPVDPGSPLLTLPNVVLTPHLGARAIESQINATRNAVDNACRVARGEDPDWVVDPV